MTDRTLDDKLAAARAALADAEADFAVAEHMRAALPPDDAFALDVWLERRASAARCELQRLLRERAQG